MTTTLWDPRTNLAGGTIGRRDLHDGAARLAREFLAAAMTARELGDRPRAAEYLARAGRERRRWVELVTPAPEAPEGANFWSPGMRAWLTLPR